MNIFQVNTPDDVYRFVERLECSCKMSSQTELMEQLINAKRMGSSELEIMGALQNVISANMGQIQQLLGSEGENQARLTIEFIGKAFGR